MIRRRLAASVLLTLFFLPSGQAAADDARDTAPAATCTRGERGALSELGCELAHALQPAPTGALVISSKVRSSDPLVDPDRLAVRVARVVAGALGTGNRAAGEAADLTRARTLASSTGTLVHLELTVAAGELRIVADVYPVPKNFWDRVRDPHPSPRIHAFASRALDPELRTFLPPVPLVAGRVLRAQSPEATPVALGCGDVDGDGAAELVLVGRREVRLGRIRSQTFVTQSSAEWATLSPIAQSPWREPIGSVAIAPGRHIDLAISDRAQAVRLSPALEPLLRVGRRLPWPTQGCSRFSGIRLSPTIETCHDGDPTPPVTSLGGGGDAIAAARLLDAKGSVRWVFASRSPEEATAYLTDQHGHTAQVSGVGAQLALGDINGDGDPELVTGANVRDATADALIVHTWTAAGTVDERWRLAVPSGVRAIAICPPTTTTRAPLAIATARAIWIVE